jgi:O-antigen/teichoic acid export membrane protein
MSAMIPQAFNAVIYPQMARQYGNSHSAQDLWTIALKATGWLHMAALGAGITAWVLIPPFVDLVLPNYTPGVEAAQWAALVGLAQACSIFGNIFNILGKQRIYFLASAIGMATFFGMWHLFTQALNQPALTSAAKSMLAATLVTSLLSALLSHRVCRRHDQSLGPSTAVPCSPSRP